MSKIKILPEILSNKIAAGEVVERPASVVKELVENSLDAGSTRIIIEVENGGRALIRVSDNGGGMNHDDALLAIERYATSKIYSDQDLFSIKTLGFRGEALPSIAAVSRFTLVTREREADAGTEIIIDGGKIKQVSEVGAPPGTMITIKQLFFNTPARRKFLKSVGTEMGHIADTVSSVAMARPDVQIRLNHNNKTVKNWPATSSAIQRVMDVVGNDLKHELHPIKLDQNQISISGWVSSPRVTRRTSRGIHVYVNHRYVRDRVIQHALFQGYSQRLVKGQFPVAVVFINVACDAVDVNVHPTKNEVRFGRQHQVHEAVKRAVAQTLYETDRPGWRPKKQVESYQFPSGKGSSETAVRDLGQRRAQPSRMRNAEFGKAGKNFGRFDFQKKTDFRDGQVPPARSASPTAHRETRTAQPDSRNASPAPRDRQEVLWEKKQFSDLRMIGQYRNTYLVCESEDGLILIDQHAAHERILFEKLLDRSTAAKAAAQQLLVPETVELGFREAHALEKILAELREIGLVIEPFGGNTFVTKSVPSFLGGRDVKPLIIEIAENLATVGQSPGVKKALEQCCQIVACHGAIRANQLLSDQQLSGLLEQLDACDNPSHCPHGRPTWIKWDQTALEKLFKRIV
jgi:DNA mismatch repair protein MutL